MQPILLNDIFEYRFLSGLAFSPDGEKAGFVVKKAYVDEIGYDSTLYL